MPTEVRKKEMRRMIESSAQVIEVLFAEPVSG